MGADSMRSIIVLLLLISLCGCNSKAKREKYMQRELDNVKLCFEASVSLLGQQPVSKTEMADFLYRGKVAASKGNKVHNNADFSKLKWSEDRSRIKVFYGQTGQNIHVSMGKTEIVNPDTPNEIRQTHFKFSLPNTPCLAKVKVSLSNSNATVKE
jgi:hypothetical protein